MKFAFVGASDLTVMTARRLIEGGHDVVIIETEASRIQELQEELDCGFLHGDGTRPAILHEVDPKHTAALFCLSRHDHVNILAGLVGRTLGFGRVIAQIEDPEFEPVCREVGLRDTIVPSLTISRHLADMVTGHDTPELSAVFRDEARIFRFEVTDGDVRDVGEIELPADAKLVCLYRDGKFMLADADTRLRAGDEAVVLTHSRNVSELNRRWPPPVAEEHSGEGPNDGKPGTAG